VVQNTTNVYSFYLGITQRNHDNASLSTTDTRVDILNWNPLMVIQYNNIPSWI